MTGHPDPMHERMDDEELARKARFARRYLAADDHQDDLEAYGEMELVGADAVAALLLEVHERRTQARCPSCRDGRHGDACDYVVSRTCACECNHEDGDQ